MAEARSILDHYPDYEATIGIEVHVQLATNSKIFCSCPNQVAQEPNSNICPICAGYPGVLPVLNQQIVEFAIRAGLATNSTIAHVSEFARKHYFYPDLPKNFQTTQNDRPICQSGYVTIKTLEGTEKKVRLIRIHMEEDAGKNIHSPSGESFVDLNRAGTPLLEIVSYPDITNAHEAKEYLKALRLMVQYIGIGSGNMEEGAFRADTNVSVRKKGAAKLGTRCELKNINSFKFIGDAIEYELERQIQLLEDGKTVRQETRLWDTKDKKTIVMRSKEEAADYRYFPEPDLPLIEIDQAWIDKVKASMPELPYAKMNRLMQERGLSAYEADIIVNDLKLADYYEQAATHTSSKLLINWILRDLIALLKDQKITLAECHIQPKQLAQLVNLIEKGTINNNSAKTVFEQMALTGNDPQALVKELGLEQMGSTQELEAIVRKIVDAHPTQAAEYKAGQQKLFGFFVGLVMKETKGKGNPPIIQELLKKYLA